MLSSFSALCLITTHLLTHDMRVPTSTKDVDSNYISDDPTYVEEVIEETIISSKAYVTKVAGGYKTHHSEFPYMAALGCKQLNNKIEYHCGGALIAPKLVLTAAHCIKRKGPVPDHVRIGGASLDDERVENQPVEVFKIHVHPLYKRREFYNDIALLELKEESIHAPACLWKEHSVEVENVTAIGYGQTIFAGPNTNDLLKASLAVIPNERCTLYYYPPYAKLRQGIVETQICAGDLNAVSDTCQGDSGGPIVGSIGEWPLEFQYVLGVTSFGQGCASGSPSIFVRVSKYIDWMEGVTNINFTTCVR